MDDILKNYFSKNRYGRIYYNLKNRKIDYPPKLPDGSYPDSSYPDSSYPDSNNLYGYYKLYNIENGITNHICII